MSATASRADPAVCARDAWRLGVSHGLAPRLLRLDLGAPETLEQYRAAGGYAGGALAEDVLLAAVEAAGLRGRGGAAFPTATKWKAVTERPGPRLMVANAAEGEPVAMKDRWLLRWRPHLVPDGLLLAAGAIEADRAYRLRLGRGGCGERGVGAGRARTAPHPRRAQAGARDLRRWRGDGRRAGDRGRPRTADEQAAAALSTRHRWPSDADPERRDAGPAPVHLPAWVR